MLQELQRSGGESGSSHEQGKVPWKGESQNQRSSMVKCGVSLSPASQRGHCHPSLSQGTARRTPTSWPSSRPDITSCRGQVRAPSPAAPPGPRSWSGPRLSGGGAVWGKLEQQGAEEIGSFHRFPKPRAGPCSHLLHCHRCLLLETAPEGSLGHTKTGQGGGRPRGPCLPLLAKCPSVPSSLG